MIPLIVETKFVSCQGVPPAGPGPRQVVLLVYALKIDLGPGRRAGPWRGHCYDGEHRAGRAGSPSGVTGPAHRAAGHQDRDDDDDTSR